MIDIDRERYGYSRSYPDVSINRNGLYEHKPHTKLVKQRRAKNKQVRRARRK